LSSVNWILILAMVGVALTGMLAIAAAIAAGGNDRASEGGEAERAAIWQAGFAPEDLRVLAGLAAVARVDLAAEQIEIVLWRGATGVVVTGSRLPPGRLGATVALDEGVAGRAARVPGAVGAGRRRRVRVLLQLRRAGADRRRRCGRPAARAAGQP
jgi:hypothetical protein